MKIGLAEPLEFFKVLIVKNGAEHAGQLPEARLRGLVELTSGEQPVDQVRLPQRNHPVAQRCRGAIAARPD
jgi:hypothetical protein